MKYDKGMQQEINIYTNPKQDQQTYMKFYDLLNKLFTLWPKIVFGDEMKLDVPHKKKNQFYTTF